MVRSNQLSPTIKAKVLLRTTQGGRRGALWGMESGKRSSILWGIPRRAPGSLFCACALRCSTWEIISGSPGSCWAWSCNLFNLSFCRPLSRCELEAKRVYPQVRGKAGGEPRALVGGRREGWDCAEAAGLGSRRVDAGSLPIPLEGAPGAGFQRPGLLTCRPRVGCPCLPEEGAKGLCCQLAKIWFQNFHWCTWICSRRAVLKSYRAR